ncbi:pyrin domain-containing protein 1-like isoform 1-T1 [Spinachia spinachia]
MSVKRQLLRVLQDLRRDDFKLFQWHLSDVVRGGCTPIPKSRLEDAERPDTVDMMMRSYGEQGAVEVAVHVLKLSGNWDAAEKLKHTSGGGAASSSASAVAPPAAPSTMSAREQSVLIAPSFAGATVGTLTINVQK